MTHVTSHYHPPVPVSGTYDITLKGVTEDERYCLNALLHRNQAVADLLFAKGTLNNETLAQVLGMIYGNI